MTPFDLSTQFFEFISSHTNCDINTLRLKSHGKSFDFDVDLAITQIALRKKGIHKLNHFISNPLTVFPSEIAYEQASHESVAAFHASLIPSRANVLDMTAGLGIDSMAISRKVRNVTACETDSLKAATLKYNSETMGITNLKVENTDSINYLRLYPGRFDFIFVDPARRGSANSRVYNLHNCTPDILGIMDILASKCDTLMIKASPLLDISQTLKDIPLTRKIRTISVAGECKEVLIEASEGSVLEEEEAIDLSPEGKLNYRFSFSPDHNEIPLPYSSCEDIVPGAYLYEPGAAVMKLSPWIPLILRYPGLTKLGVSSHLFASGELYPDFPGRILKIDSIIDKKGRKTLKGTPANVVTRNYPLTSDELRKKLGVREGTDSFIYASRLGNSPVLLSATRIRI